MIELHERLSEFSYGYGVTREVERTLNKIGVRTVPFMPSLLQEKEIGFDVGFGGRGVPLLLQFKLGQSLQRFVRQNKSIVAPTLSRPFWRFSVDTAELDGQFETLLKAETDGAEVYYVAPRFTDWPQYVRFFEEEEVLDNSVLVTPSTIRDALDSAGSPDGKHRVVYDGLLVHVCSEPVRILEIRPDEVARRVQSRVSQSHLPLGTLLQRVYGGLDDRSSVRRASPSFTEEVDGNPPTIGTAPLDERTPPPLTRSERSMRLERMRRHARSELDALTAALGAEMWGLGIQLLLAIPLDAKSSGQNG